MTYKKFGFTLIELLAVVLILAILTSIAIPQYRKAIYRAEVANALVNLRSLYDSAKRAYVMQSAFPTSFAGLDIKLLSDTTPGTTLSSGGFTFSFEGKSIKACRGTGTDLCLQVFYSATVNGKTKRDVYTCTATSKYTYVCESMGNCSDGTCVIE